MTLKELFETFNNEIQAKEDNLNDAIDDLAYIQFEDPEVERICHEQLHVYTYADAKKIIELNARSGFYNSEIKSFDELKYFINLKKIEKYTFYFCKSLQQINIPNSITKISSGAFCDCESLQQIYIPDNVTEIGIRAFCNCESLQQINIPNSVTEIGSCAFFNCNSLEAIYVSKENYEEFKDREFGTLLKIKNDSNLINETFNNEIQAQEDNINDAINELSYIQFEDPEVERICHEQLYVYTYEDAKKIIELNARSRFYSSEIKSFNELKYFINLKKIGEGTFGYCKSLQQINIPNSVTEIDDYAFKKCESLQQINIPNGVTEIGSYAFFNCNSLQQINIPNGITKIGYYTFFNCNSLQQINIPNGVTEIDNYAFSGCKSLQQINIPNSVTEIGSCAFSNCISLQHINIPNKVIKIGNSAFEYCKSLQQINIPNGVTEIGSCAFCNCESLQQINIPNGVTEIGSNVFLGCESLQIIDISGITSITKLKSLAFENYSNLKTIYVSPILYKKIYKYKNSKKYQKFLNIFDKFKIKELHETFNNEMQAQEDDINDAIDDLTNKNITSYETFHDEMVFWIKNNHGIYFSPEYMEKQQKKLNSPDVWYENDKIRNDVYKKGYLGLTFNPDTKSKLYHPNVMTYCRAKIRLIKPDITLEVLWDKYAFFEGKIFDKNHTYKTGISFSLSRSYPYNIKGTNINKIILNHFSNSIIKNKKDKIIFKSDRNTLFKVLNYYKNNLYVSNNTLKLH